MQERRCGFRVFLRMEQAVEFEPTDSVVFMLNAIANNIAQRNADYLTIACVQTSPISFVARRKACNKGNRRRLHAGNLTTLQNVSISISGFTNRLVNPFSQACFNLFMLFKTFTFDSFVFPLRNFWRQKHVARSEAESKK